MNKYTFAPLMILIFWIGSSSKSNAQPKKIITLSSAITETVFALDVGKSIAAVDVTSESPGAAKLLPRVSKNRLVSAEAIVAYRPDLVFVPKGDFSRETVIQLHRVGIKIVEVQQEFSVRGCQAFIRQIASALGIPEKGEQLVSKTTEAIKVALAAVQNDRVKPPKVLFIYARGTGVMNVAGKGSSLDAIIKLAGGRNAIQEFNDFKPYTTEALVKANPDVILMFDFGLSSLGGLNAILELPGVNLTNAGRNKKIVTMNGPLLVNFSTRLPEAITELHKNIK